MLVGFDNWLLGVLQWILWPVLDFAFWDVDLGGGFRGIR